MRWEGQKRRAGTLGRPLSFFIFEMGDIWLVSFRERGSHLITQPTRLLFFRVLSTIFLLDSPRERGKEGRGKREVGTNGFKVEEEEHGSPL